MTSESIPLLPGLTVGEPHEWHVSYRGIDYPGEVIVARAWREEWGAPLQGDRYFRTVLLLAPGEAKMSALGDPRIAVCLPDREALGAAASLGQRQRSLRETQATYLASSREDLLRLTPTLAEEQRQLAQQSSQAYLLALAQGVVATPGGEARAQEVVGEPSTAEEMVERLGAWLLAARYRSLAVDSSRFPSALTPDHVATLFTALTGQSRAAMVSEVAGAFGPGLGLCQAEAPLALTPGVSLIISRVERAFQEGGGRVVVGPLLDSLAHEEGLTYPLATLGLLLYLFTAEHDLELALVPGHPLALREGAPLAGDTLFRELISELAWPAGLRRWVRVLRPVSPVTWRGALPWTQVLLPHAVGLLSRAEEAEQRSFVVARLQETGAALKQAVATIEGLAELMRVRLPEELQALDPLEAVCRAQDMESFVTRARAAIGGPLALRKALDGYQRAWRLAQVVPQVRQVYTYLREAPDLRENQVLGLQRLALIALIDLEELFHDPSRWEERQASFDSFRRQYASLYAERHTAYHRQVAILRSRLAQVEVQARALEQFNTLTELGPPLGADLPPQVRGFLAALQVCPVAAEALDLRAVPLCNVCRFLPGGSPPQELVESVAHGVEEALYGQNQRLSRAALRRILARSDEALTDQFVKVVQSSDLTALSQVLDPSVIEFLRRFLREA